MSEILHRAFASELELRSGGDGRTVSGIAVPFNQPAQVGRFTETFARGSFGRTIAERGPERVKFFAQHGHQVGKLPIGRATMLREDSAGLYAELRVSETRDGDEALALIRDGALDSFSIGFKPVDDEWNQYRSAVTRREVALFEVSAVSMPVYETALIEAVRSDDVLSLADARALLERHRGDVLSVPDAYRRLVSAFEGRSCNDD
jgi:HK97 family phage prohead protease